MSIESFGDEIVWKDLKLKPLLKEKIEKNLKGMDNLPSLNSQWGFGYLALIPPTIVLYSQCFSIRCIHQPNSGLSRLFELLFAQQFLHRTSLNQIPYQSLY